jgi:hypothetical protein
MRATERYIKFDPRHLSEANAAIEDYIRKLDSLTDYPLPGPNTSKILLSRGLPERRRTAGSRHIS